MSSSATARLVILLFFILLALAVFGLIALSPEFSEKRIFKSILRNEIGKNWSEITVKEDEIIKIRLASGGDYYTEPYKIPYSVSEYLEVLASIRGYYLDSKGRLKSVLIPLVVKLNSGTIIDIQKRTEYASLDDFGGNVVSILPTDDELLRNNNLIGDTKYKLVVTAFITDNFQLIKDRFSQTNPVVVKLIDLQEKYYLYNKEKLENFVASGDLGEKMLFSFGVLGSRMLR